jgi:hypothetical protein
MRGHVRERGKGNWYAVIDRTDPATGKRKRKWQKLKAKGKREAQIECARLISDVSDGIYIDAKKTTLKQFLESGWHSKSRTSRRELMSAMNSWR